MKSARITVRFPPALKQLINVAAVSEGHTPASFVRHAVTSYMIQQGYITTKKEDTP